MTGVSLRHLSAASINAASGFTDGVARIEVELVGMAVVMVSGTSLGCDMTGDGSIIVCGRGLF